MELTKPEVFLPPGPMASSQTSHCKGDTEPHDSCNSKGVWASVVKILRRRLKFDFRLMKFLLFMVRWLVCGMSVALIQTRACPLDNNECPGSLLPEQRLGRV